MYCPKCGESNPDNASFCGACGEKLGVAGAHDTGQPPPPHETGYSTPPPPPPPPSYSSSGGSGSSSGLELGTTVNESFNGVMASFGEYLVLALAAVFSVSLTLGVLLGPVMAGSLKAIRRKLSDGTPIDVGRVFNEGFAEFGKTFLGITLPYYVLMIAIWIVSAILAPIAILIGIAVGAVLPVFAIACHKITEEGMDGFPAISEAFNIFSKDMGTLAVLGIVAGLIIAVGFAICFLPGFFTLPVGLMMMAKMLNHMYGPVKS